MALIVAALVISAGLYFFWRQDASPARRMAANIAGVVAMLFVLLAIYGLIAYFRTP